jgi:peptide/nickel transport system substrate-binding protein
VKHLSTRGKLAFPLLIGFMLPILAACGGQQAAPPAAPAATAAPIVQTVLVEGKSETVVVTATPAPATPEPDAQLSDTIIIGAWQEPRGFLSYANSQAVRVEVDQIFRPLFVETNNYGFRPNPALYDGALPDLTTGNNAELVDVTVKVGEPYFSTETFTVISATAEVQTKQLVITNKIKAGLKWDDGQPLTASDFVFAFKVSCDPESGSLDQTTCPFGSSPGAGGLLTSYEATDDTTLVTKYAPGALDPTYMVTIGAPLPEHLFKELKPADIAADERATGGTSAVPLGWGAYKMKEWKKGDSIIFEANPNWSGTAPKTPNVIYKFFTDSTALAQAVITGEVDTTSGTVGLAVDQAPYMESVAKNGDINYSVDGNSASFEMLYLNYNDPKDKSLKTPHPLLSDFKVRKAIAMSLDRQKAVDTIYYGQSKVLAQPQLPQMVSYDEALGTIAFDVEAANALMEEAGWVAGEDGIRAKDGVKATMTILTTSGNAVRQKATQLWQANLKAIGIDAQLVYQPSSVVFSPDGLYGRAFDAIQFANVFSNADPGNWWYGVAACSQILTPENGLTGSNFAGWCQKDASDASTEAAYLTLDPAARKAAWEKVVAAYFSEGDAADYTTGGYPVIPLFTRPSYLATVPGLKGAALDPTAYFTWNTYEWTLEQ